MIVILGNEHSDQNLEEAVCISHSVKNFEKSINQTILPPAISK